MFPKWKLIINNWINCYSKENDRSQTVNTDALVKIISHLRENLNLNESKSFLEAHTVEEFILEKYPEFKFGNGSELSSSEDDLYLAASLLLYFVCVNSKDVNLKSAMCSQLHVEDQQTILTFSKNMMDCSPITFQNVQAAITDACGIEATANKSGHVKVAETPPVLRSLHGEVRRLQAALDAERFDRNFLQEELSRTNTKLDRLIKDKEQYKEDIMNLKAKLSLCCGGDHATKGSEPGDEPSMKLAQQLNDMEACLVRTQESLDEAIYERDGLKMKIKDLKHDRDKWLALSQQESSRAAQLADDLETERRNVQSLTELVSDLHQHNQKNGHGLDSSHMEHDDPDCSTQSLAHNVSVCSEACNYVIEVQLSEERARVEELKQQILNLQKENEKLLFSIEEDNSNHEILIREKNCVIDNLEKGLKQQTALLASFRKEHEEAVLSWEKHKINTDQEIQEKETQLNDISKQLSLLNQEHVNLETEKSNLTNKIMQLDEELTKLNLKYITENDKLITSINLLETNYKNVKNEKENLENQLEGEKSARLVQETEKYELNEKYQTLIINNKELLNEKMTLAQELLDEQCHRQIIEEQNKVLTNEKMLLLNEKEDLVKLLQIKKNACEELEGANKKLALSLKNLTDKHVDEVKSKIVELERAAENVEQLQTQCQGQEEMITEMQATVSIGLDELKRVIKEDVLLEKCLEKLFAVDNCNENSGVKKCGLLFDIAYLLTMEVKELHTVIENDRAVVKEKINYIDNLEKQLKQQQIQLTRIENDLKNVTTSYDKHKLICRNVIKQKDDHIKKINDQLCELKQDNDKLQTDRDELTKKIDLLVVDMENLTIQYKNEKQKLTESLLEQETILFNTIKEKDQLNEQLQVEISTIATLNTELKQVQAAKDALKVEKSQLENSCAKLIADRDGLLKEKYLLTQKLSEENALKQIAVEEKIELEMQKIVNEGKHIEQIKHAEDNLAKKEAELKIVLEEKECLTKQLSEEKNARELLIKDKENILRENDSLRKRVRDMEIEKDEISKDFDEIIDKNSALEEECSKEKDLNDALKIENQKLLQDLTEERRSNEATLKEKESLSSQIESLNSDNLQYKSIQTALFKHKELLFAEKEDLLKSLEQEKSDNEDLVTEKYVLSVQMNNLKDHVKSQIEIKNVELKKVADDLSTIQLKYQELEETNKQIENAINTGINKLIQVLTQEHISNEFLQQLLTIDKENISVNDKCNILVNIANNLVAEVVVKKTIEKTLADENVALMELKQVLEKKELQLFDLNTEVKQLHDVIEETKIELQREKKSYATAVEEKNRELQLIQNENQSLNNDLNDVKIQLEIKVHSLKEKLVENEDLTDKLKKTYECQIDNLNVMITKLSNYLKDKTSELEVSRKEKDRLQQVIEENNKVIKALEENVIIEKQNQEKLINDFESERQVLKNMVTVTESVMEDQKVVLNKAIAEHIKTNELLKQEQTILKKEIKQEKKVYEMKVSETEATLESLTKELTALKNVKQDLEKDVEFEKETFMKEIDNLKNKIIESDIAIMNLTDENKIINSDIQNYKDDIMSLQYTNSELKIKIDTLENEFGTKSTELKKCLEQMMQHKIDLEDDLKQKTSYIFELENKLKTVVEEMKQIEQEKTVLVAQRDNYLSKVNEMQKTLEQEESSNAEERNKNFHEKKILMEKIDELNKKNIKTQEEISTYKNDNSELLEKVSKLDAINRSLEQEVAQLKDIDIKLREEINKMTQDYSSLTNQYDRIENLCRDFEATISNLKQENLKLTEDLHDRKVLIKKVNELNEQSMATGEEIFAYKNDNLKLLEKVNQLDVINKALEQEVAQLKDINIKSREEINKMTQDYYNLTNQYDKIENLYRDFEAKVGNLEQEKIKLTEDLHDRKVLMEKVSELHEQNMATGEEIFAYKNDNVELLEKVSKLDAINKALEEEVAQFKDIDTKSKEQINKLTQDYSNLTNQYDKSENLCRDLEATIGNLKQENKKMTEKVTILKTNNLEITAKLSKCFHDNAETVQELDKLKKDCIEYQEKITEMEKVIQETEEHKVTNDELQKVMDKLNNDKKDLISGTDKAKLELKELAEVVDNLKRENSQLIEQLNDLKKDNLKLVNTIDENKAVITQYEHIGVELEQYKRLKDEMINEKLTLSNKCDILEEYHSKAEKELEERQKEINSLKKEMQTLLDKVDLLDRDSKAKDGLISKMSKEKDAIINDLNKKLSEENVLKEKLQNDVEEKQTIISQLKHNLEQINNEREALNILKKENEELIKVVGQRETFAARGQDNASGQKNSDHLSEKELQSLHHQVDNTSDITHTSTESLKTISDLEKIIHDKNRNITFLQSDLTYMKTLMAESEMKLLDATKELEISRENCHQLSSQLKKIVQHKNEELSDLKKQVTKMSVNENRATQIIKVSAKYQAIILKRIAEIKSGTVLKELQNYGNTNSTDNELRRSLTAGSITMEDLENFLETTEKHIKRCSEKQTVLQKERDRLIEVNRINESEIINLQKFLTELSVSFKTFTSIKDLYAQKLSKVISVQRTVRREILSLEGHITDACMLKLERGYAAVMQDLAECTMNLERWAERTIGRTISSEKIKQAYANDSERTSLAPTSVKNAGLEVQLDELENSFHKLLEEVVRAQKGEGAREEQAVTVMEVRAEYEDKLNRMKAKMKQLYAEQIAVFKEKQREEIETLERELVRAREKLAQSSQLYEEHIRGLTSELWTVGEKFLRQKDEAEWLRRRQASGSLMSLQHVHSSGLVPKQEDCGRPSGAQSLRSLQPSTNSKREGRGLHMSDEEGEVFDNRFLKELETTPRAPRGGTGARLSELQWRNSMCLPHLKSSYPAETQFVPVLDEDEIKAMGPGVAGSSGMRQQRKEVGITAYKKPGPPTPSKQAGRLSATDSELRESLRVEAEPQPSRKTSTPSRIRSLFRSNKNDTTEGTPRNRRLSSIFRKRL